MVTPECGDDAVSDTARGAPFRASGETVRDIVIGMSDGLTVPFARRPVCGAASRRQTVAGFILIEGTTSVREFVPDVGGVVLEMLKPPVGTQDDHGHG